MITVDTLSILNKLKIKEEGDTAYVNKEEKIYKQTNGEWVEQGLPQGKMNVNIYDMNKQIISQFKPLEDKAIMEPIRKLKNEGGKYFMLICRDIGYYTLYTIGTGERIEREVVACLHDIGEIKGIERIEETDTLEIWVQPEGEDPIVMQFFNYDKGVIECQ